MGKGYTIQGLKKAMLFAKTNPDGLIPTGSWTNPYLTGEEWQGWFLSRLNEKINRNERPRGRKDSYQWWCDIRRAADQINHPRLIIDWLPPDLKQRFAYRLRCNMDL